MRKSLLLATTFTFGVALLAAAPAALAQQSGAGRGYGFDPPRGTPLTPDSQGAMGLIPNLGQQYTAARRAEATAASANIEALLRDAYSAMARRNFGLANEFLERAETELLNRKALAGGTPPGSDLQSQIAEARQALMNRDSQLARQRVQEAENLANRDATIATGAGTTSMQPAQSGGGSTMMTPGSQGLGRGNAAVGSQYNPTAVPPYGGPTGTQTMPSQHMPGTSGTQASGVPSVAPTGRGAPPSGQAFPQSGGTSSQLSTGGQIQPGSVTTGTGSGGGPGGSGAGGGSGR